MENLQGKSTVLYKYFGPKAGETLRDFNTEIKALSGEEKEYLAREAAKELGLSQSEVSFIL